MWVFYLLWMIFQCSAVCQRRIVPIQLHFFVTLILSKVICYSWTSLCVSGSVPSAHWSVLLPHSDLWFSTDNPSVHRHVRCLSVWRTSLIRLGEGFCDKHATSHQRLTPHRRFKEIWETTRVSHLSVLFGLQPGGGVYVCVWMYLSRTVRMCDRAFVSQLIIFWYQWMPAASLSTTDLIL